MRLATVLDTEVNEPKPVFELPGGQRIALRELFRVPGVADALDEVPLYFTDLSTTVQHLDDVVSAVRAWASQRAETADREVLPTTMNRMPFCPPIPAPPSIRQFDTFERHVQAMRGFRKLEIPAVWYDQPTFSFANVGSLVGHHAPISAPADSNELDFGLELATVIGTGGRDIEAYQAWNHVAGFTIVNTVCARDIERRALSVGMGPGKARDFCTVAGPYLITIDALRDRIDSAGRIHLNMVARRNGKELTRANAASMHFSWPELIEYASRDVDLHPGDMLCSGTVPGGSILEIGVEQAGGWLRPGDVIELEIERLGILRTPVRARSELPTASENCGSTSAAVL